MAILLCKYFCQRTSLPFNGNLRVQNLCAVCGQHAAKGLGQEGAEVTGRGCGDLRRLGAVTRTIHLVRRATGIDRAGQPSFSFMGAADHLRRSIMHA
jgi:hypothetical protein